MASGFVIVKKEQANKKAEEKSPAELLENWFSFVKHISPQTTAKLRKQIQHKLETNVGEHLFAKMPPEHKLDCQFKHCIEETIREEWDALEPEERLLVRFPTGIRAIGEQVEIPKRGIGVLIRRELTRRFGIEMVFKMRDGSFFKHEFID
jgi:hypothetical protein